MTIDVRQLNGFFSIPAGNGTYFLIYNKFLQKIGFTRKKFLMEKIDSCGADRFLKEFRILTRKIGATEE